MRGMKLYRSCGGNEKHGMHGGEAERRRKGPN